MLDSENDLNLANSYLDPWLLGGQGVRERRGLNQFKSDGDFGPFIDFDVKMLLNLQKA